MRVYVWVCVCVQCWWYVCVCVDVLSVGGIPVCTCVGSVDVFAHVCARAHRIRAGDPVPSALRLPAPLPSPDSVGTLHTQEVPRSVQPEGRERQRALSTAQMGKCFINKGLEENRRLPVWAVAWDRTAEQTQALSTISGQGWGYRRTPARGVGQPFPPAHLAHPPSCNALLQPPQKLSREGPK